VEAYRQLWKVQKLPGASEQEAMGIAQRQVEDTLHHGELLIDLYSALRMLHAKMVRTKIDECSEGL
jgi:hypothetical protein